MKKLLLCITICIFLISNSKSSVIKAISLSHSDINSAILQSSDGDTIIFPADTVVWTSEINISGKSVSLFGAGANKTKIIINSGFAIKMDCSDRAFTFSGFTLDGNNGVGSGIYLISSPSSYRISNIVFNQLSVAIEIEGKPDGVISNCSFVNTKYAELRLFGDCESAWDRATPLGSSEAVYIEDCKFTLDSQIFNPNYQRTIGHLITSNGGSRWVLRYCEFNIDYENGNLQIADPFDSHGFCYNSYCDTERSSYSSEFYENIVNLPEEGYRILHIRGGTGVVFNNVINGGERFEFGLFLNNYRSWDNTCQTGGLCEDQEGYPCQDQIFEFYEWNNSWNGSPLPVNVEGSGDTFSHIQEGRDYFVNTEKPGYEAYTYPHPLAGGNALTENSSSNTCDVADINVIGAQ